MKIAVATDDKKTIRKGHFGSSKYFLIFEILNGEIKSEELRENPYADEEHASHHRGKTEKIIELLSDCGLFMAASVGRKSGEIVSQHNIDLIITEKKDVEEAVTNYLDGEDEGYQYWNSELGGFAPCSSRMSVR